MIVKLNPASKVRAFLDMTVVEAALCTVDPHYSYVDIPIGEAVGSVDGMIKANTRVTLVPAAGFKVLKHSAIVQPNPVLFKSGIIQCQTFLAPGEGGGYVVHFSASKQVCIEDIPYLIRVYIND